MQQYAALPSPICGTALIMALASAYRDSLTPFRSSIYYFILRDPSANRRTGLGTENPDSTLQLQVTPPPHLVTGDPGCELLMQACADLQSLDGPHFGRLCTHALLVATSSGLNSRFVLSQRGLQSRELESSMVDNPLLQ